MQLRPALALVAMISVTAWGEGTSDEMCLGFFLTAPAPQVSARHRFA